MSWLVFKPLTRPSTLMFDIRSGLPPVYQLHEVGHRVEYLFSGHLVQQFASLLIDKPDDFCTGSLVTAELDHDLAADEPRRGRGFSVPRHRRLVPRSHDRGLLAMGGAHREIGRRCRRR